MPRLTLALLGGFQARIESGPSLTLPTRKAQALVAYLAIPAGQPHSRDELAALLWGGRSDDSARNSLRQALFGIRQALAATVPPSLVIEGATVVLDRSAVDIDVAAFEREATEGTLEALQRAVSLYRGDLLVGLAVQESPFEEWLRTERERLRELALQCLTKVLAYHCRCDATELAIQTALRLLGIDPLQETVYRALMDLYLKSGRRGSALRQYQLCVSALQRELGVEPEPDTKALYQEILRAPLRRPSNATVMGPAPLAPDTVLVGRDAELALLCAALTDAMAHRGRVMTVLGEEGIGKTRLMAELAGEASRRAVALLIGRAYESEQTLPLGPWADALRGARLTEHTALLESLGPACRAQLTRVLPEVHAGHEPASGESDYRQVFESVLELIRLLAAKQPLVVILEDLHWADQMTVRLAAFLGHRLHAWPVMLVLTAREDELCDAPQLVGTLDELARESHVGRLTLLPLTKPGTEALVRTLSRTGAGAAPRDLAERVWILSEGNPFVVMEAMRAIDRRQTAATLALPQRVRKLVQRRLERLSETSQHLVAVAAIIGRDFEFALLQRASGFSVSEAAECVEELVRRRVVQDVGERLDFVHNRIRETALARLLPHRRAMLHRAVADAIEALYMGALEAHDVALGTHYREAGLWDRAMMYSGRAGIRALSDGAYHEAAILLRAALDALDHLPEAHDTAQLRADLLVALAIMRYHVGDVEGMLGILRSVESITTRTGDARRLRRCLEAIAFCLGSLGDLPGAIQTVKRAAANGGVDGAPATRFVYQAARPYYGIGDYRRAVETARAEIDILQGQRLHARGWGLLLSVRARFWLILSLAELGEFPEALRVANETLGLADATRNATDLLFACLSAGRVYLVKGDLPNAISTLEQALPLCQTDGDCFIYRSRVATSLGLADVLSGRTDEGLALLHEAVAADRSLRFAYSQSLTLANLAEGHLLAGGLGQAQQYAAQALETARTHGHRGWEAWTLRLHGEIARHGNAPRAAGGFYRDAMSLARKLGMRPLLAHCHRGLASLDARARARKAHLSTATKMYREMDMRLWLEGPGTRMRELG